MQINSAALRHLLKNRGYIQIPSNGVSMVPLIRTHSICRFEPVELSGLQAGDILLFVSNSGELIGHRYHRSTEYKGELRYICKGDSNRNADPPITANQIIGKMVSIQYSKLRVRTDNLLMKAWGKMIVKFPLLSVCIHYGLRLKNKFPGKRISHEANKQIPANCKTISRNK